MTGLGPSARTVLLSGIGQAYWQDNSAKQERDRMRMALWLIAPAGKAPRAPLPAQTAAPRTDGDPGNGLLTHDRAALAGHAEAVAFAVRGACIG